MLRRELTAATVGAVAVLPSAVAWGVIAFAPLGADWIAFGISASVGSFIVFGILNAAFGTCQLMSAGALAATSLVFAACLQTALNRGVVAEDAALLAFCSVIGAGGLQAVAGLVKLGRVFSHVPRPVTVGFAVASTFIVLISSIPTVLGMPNTRLWQVIAGEVHNINFAALSIGALTIAVVFIVRDSLKPLPAELVSVVVGSLAYYGSVGFLGVGEGPVVGVIEVTALLQTPVLMVSPSKAIIVWDNLSIVLPAAVSLALLLSFATTMSASAVDEMTKRRSDANGNLRVHGGSNILMGILGFLPGGGAYGMSSVLIKAGATTRLSNGGVGVLLLLLLSSLSPLVAMLPLWALSGMLIASVLKAIDLSVFRKMQTLWKSTAYQRRVLASDVAVSWTVVLTGVVFDLIVAVAVGVLLSVVLFVMGMGRDPIRRGYSGARVRSKTLRSHDQIDYLSKEGQRIWLMEIQGALFFGACTQLHEKVEALIAQGVDYLILDFQHVTSIDSTGAEMLKSLHAYCADAGTHLMISRLEVERRLVRNSHDAHHEKRNREASAPRWVWLTLNAYDVIQTIGDENLFDDRDFALSYCEERLLSSYKEDAENNNRGAIAGSAIFDGLSRAEIAKLLPFSKRVHFEKGDVVFRQGDVADCAFLLVHGGMDILIDIPGSDRVKRVSSLGHGAVFGEMGIIDGESRSATVRAKAPSACYQITSDNFDRIQHLYPNVFSVLLRNISRQFSDRLRVANLAMSELEK